MLQPAELMVIKYVLDAAEIYGYGNLIGHLKRAWAQKLVDDYGFTWEQALQGADVSAYPQAFTLEALKAYDDAMRGAIGRLSDR